MSRLAAVVRPALLSLAASFPVAAVADGPPPPPSTEAGTVVGRVTAASGVALEDVPVRLVDLRLRTRSDAEGAFRFEGVPAGLYLIEAVSPRYGRSVTRVEVKPGEPVRVEVALDVDVHHEVIVVSAQADARSEGELAQPVNVLSGSELQLRLQPTLGETLGDEPGVSSTYFGPGASRPIIRGLGGDRIRVLEDGLGTADASGTSPDHAVSYNPVSADQIEVVRGPATLLYGSSAVGGVVNILDRRIPDAAADHVLGGLVDFALGSVADEKSGAGAVQAGKGPLVVRGDYFRRDAGDLSIPGYAESPARRDGDEASFGTLPNSAVESEGGALALSAVLRRGFLGLSASGYDTLYGVPGGHHHEEEGEEHEEGHSEEEAGEVRIDLEQRRFDVRGGLTEPFGAFRAAKLRFGLANYRHAELEGDEVGTTFDNDAWEGRLEMLHKPLGALTGAFGVQAGRRDFEAIGAEAFLPPTRTRSLAVFAFEELGSEQVKLLLGARYENQRVEAFGEAPQQRDLDGFSGSAGVAWSAASGWGVGLTLARSVKLPNAEELFSNGPHIATRAFEVGDPDLESETSLGVDLSLRKRGGRVGGELNLFANWFDRYIYDELTGEEEDGLRVVQFVQRDARFVGAEIETHVELVETEPHHLDLELGLDFVQAELTDTGENLPRIPPLRYRAGLHYHSERWSGRVELAGAAEQDRLAEFELPTEGYAFLNAAVGYRLFLGRTVCDLLLRGTNLADAEGRLHTSFLKDVAPLPGRDVRFSARLTF